MVLKKLKKLKSSH